MAEEIKPYEQYNETNIFWTTSIPLDWKEVKIKHLFFERSEKGFPDEQLLSATQSRGVIPTLLFGNRTVVATKGFDTLKLVEIGDFVISLRSFQGGIEYAYYRGIISPAYTVMTPKSLIYKGYFKYLAKSNPFIDLLKTCVTGIREGQNINYSLLKKSAIPVPPIEEQDQIVRFLDFKISKINKFIKDKKREIELLKELKKAEINHAVTKGLNPNVPMKDSGIDWLGEIPEHWEVRRLKKCVALINEKGNPNGGNYIGLENIVSWTGNYIKTSTPDADGISNQFMKNDILFGKLRPYLAKCIIAEFDGICSSELLVFRDFIGVNLYLKMVLISYDLINYINSSTYGAKMPRASWNFIGNCSIPLPPVDEQQEIINQLNKKIKNIDKLIFGIEQEIVFTQEYKTRLISDVVTGKVDIRHVKIDDVFELETIEEPELETEEVIEE